MHVPANDSAFWPTMRFGIVAVLLLIMLTVNYNKFDGRDIVTILTVLGGLAGFDVAKKIAAAGPKDTKDKQDDTPEV